MLYVVTMYRWGDREKHSYVIGVFDDEDKAIGAGVKEEQYRDGKYKAEVLGFTVNNYQQGYWAEEVIVTTLGDKIYKR